MKKLILLGILTLFLFSFDTSKNCDTMYSNATYGVMHSKKAFKARNYDDQRYFAGKALEAYHRVLENLKNCGCADLTYQVEDAIDNLESATDPYDWDKGIYYSKKVYLSSLDIMIELDELISQQEVQE